MKINPIKQKVYKVVTQINDTYQGAFLNEVSGDQQFCGFKLVLKYKVGEITRADPKTYGIFCFDNLENARCFLAMRFTGQIFKAEAYRAKRFCSRIFKNGSTILNYWRPKDALSSACREEVPNGTLVCRSLKLLKRID